MSKFAPGPWYQKNLPHEVDHTIIRASDGHGGECVVAKVGLYRSEAHANLIASAPELLDALKVLVEEIWRAKIASAERAIAKAEGK